MRPASAALQSYLAANDIFLVIDLYTFALPSGEVLRYSGWTTPLAIPGTAFAAGASTTTPRNTRASPWGRALTARW